MSMAGTPGFRFPKSRRLVCSPEYQSVIAHDCRSMDALFVVYAHGNGRQLGRLGVTVSRRVASRAVERNRIKRAIRESFRHQENILMGLDIVTITRGAAHNADTKLLFKSLKEHWRRVDHALDGHAQLRAFPKLGVLVQPVKHFEVGLHKTLRTSVQPGR